MKRAIPAACLILALSACNRDAPPDAASTGTDPAPVAAAPAPAEDSAPASRPGADDPKALAGRFSAGTVHLDLREDGSYVLDDAGAMSDGTWTIESDDTRLRLDPNSKSEPDRLFAIASADLLTGVDTEGAATAAGAMTLRRDGR